MRWSNTHDAPPGRKLTVALAAGTMLLAACKDHPTESPLTAPQPEARASAASALPEQVPNHVRPAEKAFRDLARQVPAFGGFYFNESGELVAQVTDLGRGASMRAALVPFLQQLAAERGNPNGRLPEIVLRKADYSFAQLSDWRHRIEGPVFALEAVVLIDLDERENRLFIGLADESGRAEAEAKLREVGVPLEVVRIAVVGEATPQATRANAAAAVTSVGCGHLQDYCRPLIGGYQIAFARDGGAPNNGCTLGFTALSGGQPRFITNAHCSDDEWNLESTVYYQSSAYNGVGKEVADPRGWSCDFLYTWKCRYSDANLVQPSVETEVGYIARPTGLGSLTVSSSQPRFTISGQSDAYAGEAVYGIGRTTGLYGGTVDKTCTDYKKTWDGRYHKVVCTDVADYNTQDGDSGGPVFIQTAPDRVTLVGVNFARNDIYDHSFFSPISGIQKDLGTLEARAPEFRSSTGGGGGGGGCPDCEEPL